MTTNLPDSRKGMETFVMLQLVRLAQGEGRAAFDAARLLLDHCAKAPTETKTATSNPKEQPHG